MLSVVKELECYVCGHVIVDWYDKDALGCGRYGDYFGRCERCHYVNVHIYETLEERQTCQS